ncbi:5-formyltetrahydrofolate cyclo-ligase [Alsobacter soli]|uniref:5-formyltetrahydrofolate cyclo-ligase n=1 Tax=Alsobacter soli TaxID=2109933 RepID=A0A2T1HZ74_9HYPH|nr:5-formyltetrahydrofolate cyclo-ligase [Alsobacter soli]PSC06971.1 5-formyltetrahydrofolate cyclo-ligase [Alsobacter soli]
MTHALDKAAIRQEVLARRDALSDHDRARFSAALAEHALPFRAAIHEGPVSGFWPIRSEVDPRPLMRLFAAHGAELCLPVVRKAGMVFRSYRFGDALVSAGFGLSEPPESAPQSRPRVMLTPLAAFDRRGDRIGYGAGYYDRAIARFLGDGRPLTIVGLAFSLQEVERVPAEPHDRRLDWILTEREVIRPTLV